MPSLALPLVLAPWLLITLPRAGERNVGSAPVASAALTGASAGVSSILVVAWASRAVCCGPAGAAAAKFVAGGAKAAAGWAAATTTGAAGATAAVFPAGTVSFMPSLSFAWGSMLLALASSATDT